MSKRRIIIDPGHGQDNDKLGRHDPGNMGGGIRESRLALIYASALEQQLLARDFDVVLTRRSQDQPMPVGNRAPMAERVRAAAMISIHTNSAADRYGGIDPLPRGTLALHNLAADRDLALALVDGICAALETSNRGAELADPAKLAVMRTYVPVYLIELAFQSNASDLQKLLAPDSPIRVAQALSTGLIAHFSEFSA